MGAGNKEMSLSLLVFLALEFVTRAGGSWDDDPPAASSLGSLVLTWCALGWKRVAVVTPPPDGGGEGPYSKTELARLLSSSSGSGVSPSILTPSDYSFSFDSGLLQTQMDSGAPYLAFLGVQRNGFLKFLHLKRRPMTAMVVVKEEEEENELKAFLDQEVCNKTSAMFFKARLKEAGSAANLFRMQTFSQEPGFVSDQWFHRTPSPSPGHYKETFELGGHTVSNTALTWKPWLDIYDCQGPEGAEKKYTGCRGRGILAEVMNSLSSTYNFSWTLDEPEPETGGGWGVSPVRNATEEDRPLTPGDYVGVLGNTLQGKYDVALSTWQVLQERVRIADFTDPVVQNPRCLIINAANPPLDLTLFVRPFTRGAWVAVLLCLLVLAPMLLIFPWPAELSQSRDLLSRRIVVISAWVFFVLLNAFYGGALTMFFSSAPSLPFETMEEGLGRHPTWELVMQEDTEATLLERAKSGDSLILDWLSRDSASGGGLTLPFPGVMSALEKGGHFTEAAVVAFASAYGELPEAERRRVAPRRVGREYTRPVSFILGKNSPVLPAIDQGLHRLRQSGALGLMFERQRLRIPAIGSSSSEEGETKVLGPDHTGVIFLCFSACLAAIVGFLGLEMAVWHLQHFYLRRWSKVAISSSSENDQHFHRLALAPLNRATGKRRLSMGDFVKAGAAEGSLYPAAVQGE